MLKSIALSAALCATQAAPALAQCSNDVLPPTISGCPANITVQTGTGNTTCSRTVTWTAPTATDNCSAVTTSSTHQPGATFSKGITEVIYTFTDASNNSASCTFYVTVEDNTVPVISAVSNIVVNNTPGTCGAVVNYTPPTFTDNCPLCPSSIPTLTAAGFRYLGYFRGKDYYRSPGKGDWDELDSIATSVGGHLATISSAAENLFLDSVNSDIAWMGLTDRDSEGYWIWANGEPNTYINWCETQPDDWLIGQNYAVLNSHGQIGPDGCWDDGHSPGKDINSIVNNLYGIIEVVNCGGINRTAGPASGATFPIGTTQVTYTAFDAMGNTTTRSFNVTVVDNQAPAITCPSNRTVAFGGNTTPTAAGTGIATATDNCGISGITSSDVSTQSADMTSCLHYNYTITRTWTATDVNGNTSSCTQLITVQDGTAPTAICKNITVTLNAAGTATINPADINNGSHDNNAPVTLVSVVPSTFSCAQAGTTVPVVLTVRDACGLTSTCTSNVTVRDNTAPVITCPSNATVGCGASTAPTAAGTGIATATDACGTPTITSSDVSTKGSNPNACSFYNYTITRTWRATDASNNSSTCTQTITVRDNTAPVAMCKNVTVPLVNGVATITPAMINNGSFDACSGIASVTLSKTSFTCANIGNNTVTMTVTDICGNTSTCTATVTVGGANCSCSIAVTPSNNTYTGGVPTNIYLGYGPQSARLTATATGGTGFSYSWSPATNLSAANVANPVFTPTAAGNYTYTVTVTNSNGCTSTCTVRFCVIDVRVPDNDNNPNNNKVYVCHVPPGNPANAHTLHISINAVPAHIGNHGGDRLGTCDQVCGSTARMISSGTRSIGEEVVIYPNPSNGSFTVEIPHTEEAEAQVTVTDVQGKVIQRRMVTENDGLRVNFSLGDVAKGVYFVDVLYGDQRSRTKLIVQ